MGKLMGAYDSDELDRPDLNKCPDCGCFFASDNCPLCNKPCPEEFRAGNRKAVKKTKKRNVSNRTVTFINWYHSWWFIILMLFFMPVVGIILLLSSPHKKSIKIIAAVIAVLYTVVTYFGIGPIINNVTNLFDKPVNTSISREEYVALCEEVDAEQYYRNASVYEDKYVSVTLTVKERITNYEAQYSGDKYYTYYICTDESGADFEIFVLDCIQDGSKNFIAGDVITVYGEGAGEVDIYDEEYNTHTAPCINIAYVK